MSIRCNSVVLLNGDCNDRNIASITTMGRILTRGRAQLIAQMNPQNLRVRITRNFTVERYLMANRARRIVSRRRTIGIQPPPVTPRSILRPSQPRRPSLGARGRRRNSLTPSQNLNHIANPSTPRAGTQTQIRNRISLAPTQNQNQNQIAIPSTSSASAQSQNRNAIPSSELFTSTPIRFPKGGTSKMINSVAELATINLPPIDWSAVSLPTLDFSAINLPVVNLPAVAFPSNDLSNEAVDPSQHSVELNFSQPLYGRLHYDESSDASDDLNDG